MENINFNEIIEYHFGFHFNLFDMLFTYGLFYDTCSSSYHIAPNDDNEQWIGKRLLPNLIYCPFIFLEGPRYATKILKVAGLRVEIWNRDIQGTEQECCPLDSFDLYAY
jgi:hypothetical protein